MAATGAGAKLKDLAAAYGVGVATLRGFANKDGVDVWDPVKVDDHISTKQRTPNGYIGLERAIIAVEALTQQASRSRPEHRSREGANQDIMPGVAETLGRLESAEASLYERWQYCEEEGPKTEAKRLHASWNATAKTLLDYDLKLDAARKEMGDMVAFAAVKTVMGVIGTRLVYSCTNQARLLWSEMRPMLKEDVHPDQFLIPFLDAARNAIVDARIEIQDDESMRPVAEQFLAEIDKHLVVEVVEE